MRRSSRWTVGLFTGVAILTTACTGGSGVTVVNTDENLRTSEIQDVFALLSEAFNSAGIDLTAQSPAAAAGIQRVPVPINSTFDESLPCESGTVSIAGSIDGTLDDVTLVGDVTLQLAWDFDACTVTSDYGILTVNGSPDIQFDAYYVFGQTDMTLDATQSGGFSYAVSDGRAGSCLIDLTYSSTYNSDTQQETNSVTGTVCGKSAQELEDVLL